MVPRRLLTNSVIHSCGQCVFGVTPSITHAACLHLIQQWASWFGPVPSVGLRGCGDSAAAVENPQGELGPVPCHYQYSPGPEGALLEAAGYSLVYIIDTHFTANRKEAINDLLTVPLEVTHETCIWDTHTSYSAQSQTHKSDMMQCENNSYTQLVKINNTQPLTCCILHRNPVTLWPSGT